MELGRSPMQGKLPEVYNTEPETKLEIVIIDW